jgi:enoyl-CoA hydratase/carnithine racemase
VSEPSVLSRLEDGLLIVTLNRPERLNAYTAEMGEALGAAIARADADDAVRAVIVTGAGKAFCAGADISAGADAFDSTSEHSTFNSEPNASARFVMQMFRCRKPIVGAINGAAAGIGVTLTLPMDARIAASTARFGFVFTRRGLVPEAGCAWFLPRIVGLSQALEWCYSGEVFGAEEALRGGLVREVVEPDALMAAARAYAHKLTANGAPVALALTRQMLWRLPWEPDPLSTLRLDEPLNRALGVGPDVREGVGAFLEKRAPNFTGRPSCDLPAPYPWWEE